MNLINESYIKDFATDQPILYYTKSDIEAIDIIKARFQGTPVRVLYDLKKSLYIFGDAYKLIHIQLLEEMSTNLKGGYFFENERETYEYLDKNCAMFKIIDENDYKSFTRSDGYRYAFIGQLGSLYVICRDNSLAKEREKFLGINVPDELKKCQQTPMLRNVEFKHFDVRSGLNKREDMPQNLFKAEPEITENVRYIMRNELFQLLNENEQVNFDAPYERQNDETIPHFGEKRKKVLSLKDLNRLKRIRNQKREEIAQDSVFVPIIYGPDMSNPEGDPMGGGLGL